LMSPEDVFETFGESHYCKNLKFEHFSESQLKMFESRTHLGKLEGSLFIKP
jgi:hypothetical protein